MKEFHKFNINFTIMERMICTFKNVLYHWKNCIQSLLNWFNCEWLFWHERVESECVDMSVLNITVLTWACWKWLFRYERVESDCFDMNVLKVTVLTWTRACWKWLFWHERVKSNCFDMNESVLKVTVLTWTC